MKSVNRFNTLVMLFLCSAFFGTGLRAKEFGYLANDPKFPGTGTCGDTCIFEMPANYWDAFRAKQADGTLILPCYGFDTLWWESCYIPLPSRDSIKTHDNTYPATDSEVADMLLYITKEFSADGFTLIVQMEGGKTFAAVDNNLFQRLGLGGAHQTDDSSDDVASVFPHPDHPIITGVANPMLWGKVKKFTWKGVGRLDKLDPKMECLLADSLGNCIFAGVEKGVIAPNDGGIFFLMDTKILSNYLTNDTSEQILWRNLVDYGIEDQFKHYVFVPSAVAQKDAFGPRGGGLAVVKGLLQMGALGTGEKSISITDLCGKRLLSVKEPGESFALPRFNHSGMVLISVECKEKRATLPYFIQ